MQDFYDAPDRPSAFKPIVYGAMFGLGVTTIFVAAYLIAPNLSTAGTCLLALAIAAIVAIALNYVPSHAADDLAAMAMGEAPTLEAVDRHSATPGDGSPSKDDLEAEAARLRQQLETINRGERPVEWVAVTGELAGTLKELGTRAMSTPGKGQRRAALANFRQAAGAYRKVVDSRGKNRSERHWGVAQIALAECQLVLGEAENARDQIMKAANGFTAALEVADLSPEERRAGESGLAQAEGVLSGLSENERRDDRDELF